MAKAYKFLTLTLHNSCSIASTPCAPYSITIPYYFQHHNFKSLAKDEEALRQFPLNTMF